MIADYINRNELVGNLDRFAFEHFTPLIRTLIEKQPAANVEEVVRCKDCKHGRKTNRIMSPEKFFKEDCVVCECEDVVGDEPMIYVPTHFCSYGEMKNE